MRLLNYVDTSTNRYKKIQTKAATTKEFKIKALKNLLYFNSIDVFSDILYLL